MAFAQIKRTNPPTLSTPTGYTHIVELGADSSRDLSPLPASTLVQVVHLARPKLMLEIEVIAAVPVPAGR